MMLKIKKKLKDTEPQENNTKPEDPVQINNNGEEEINFEEMLMKINYF